MIIQGSRLRLKATPRRARLRLARQRRTMARQAVRLEARGSDLGEGENN